MHATNGFVKRWPTIFFTGLAVAVLSAAVSFAFPLKYRADTQLFILSHSRTGVDPYTVAKSAERIGENIAQVVDTTDFFQKVLEQPDQRIDRSVFDNLPERERRKLWQKTIDASVVYGTGVLTVSAYSERPEEALEIARAAAETLVSRGAEYVGDDVTIQVVNAPIATRFPARPNVPVNAAAGFIVGGVLCAVWLGRERQA